MSSAERHFIHKNFPLSSMLLRSNHTQAQQTDCFIFIYSTKIFEIKLPEERECQVIYQNKFLSKN